MALLSSLLGERAPNPDTFEHYSQASADIDKELDKLLFIDETIQGLEELIANNESKGFFDGAFYRHDLKEEINALIKIRAEIINRIIDVRNFRVYLAETALID